jgi:hypothetical protein
VRKHRQRLRRLRDNPEPLMDLLLARAWEMALRDRRDEALGLIEEAVARCRPAGFAGPGFFLGLARLCHLLPGWEADGLRWLTEAQARWEEWVPPPPEGQPDPELLRLKAYRAVLAARLGRPEAVALLQQLPENPGGALSDVALRLAEGYLWCGGAEAAHRILERLLQGRALLEDDRHLAYLLMIDCQEALGHARERRLWLERERRWCQRRGRESCGSPASPMVRAAWQFGEARRLREQPTSPHLDLQLALLRQAMEAPLDSPPGLRLTACRPDPFPPLHEIEALAALSLAERRENLHFASLLWEHLQVGPLLLTLGELPEAEPLLIEWLDHGQLVPFAQRALAGCGSLQALARRARDCPGSPGSLRATAALGSLADPEAGKVLRELVRIPELAGAAALALAERGERAALGALRRAASRAGLLQRSWLDFAAEHLESGRELALPWKLAFLPDPASGRHRRLPHLVEELILGFRPLPGQPPCPQCGSREARPLGAHGCLCELPQVRRWAARELGRWQGAGAADLYEVLAMLAEAHRHRDPLATRCDLALPRHGPGGADALTTLAWAVRWLLGRGAETFDQATSQLKRASWARTG